MAAPPDAALLLAAEDDQPSLVVTVAADAARAALAQLEQLLATSREFAALATRGRQRCVALPN